MIAETRSNIPRLRRPRLHSLLLFYFLRKRDSFSNSKLCRIRSDPFGWKFDDEPNGTIVSGGFILSNVLVNLSRLSLIPKYPNHWKFCVPIAFLFPPLYHNFWKHIPIKKVEKKKKTTFNTSEFGNSCHYSWASRQTRLMGQYNGKGPFSLVYM